MNIGFKGSVYHYKHYCSSPIEGDSLQVCFATVNSELHQKHKTNSARQRKHSGGHFVLELVCDIQTLLLLSSHKSPGFEPG